MVYKIVNYAFKEVYRMEISNLNKLLKQFWFHFFQFNIMLQIIENLGSISISFSCIVPHYYAIIKNIYYPMIRNTIFQVHNCTQPSLALGLVIWTYKENNARFSCNIQPSRCITYRQLILICYIKKQSIPIYEAMFHLMTIISYI